MRPVRQPPDCRRPAGNIERGKTPPALNPIVCRASHPILGGTPRMTRGTRALPALAALLNDEKRPCRFDQQFLGNTVGVAGVGCVRSPRARRLADCAQASMRVGGCLSFATLFPMIVTSGPSSCHTAHVYYTRNDITRLHHTTHRHASQRGRGIGRRRVGFLCRAASAAGVRCRCGEATRDAHSRIPRARREGAAGH